MALAIVGSSFIVFAAVGSVRASPVAPPLPAGAEAPGWSSWLARSLGLDGLGWTGLTVLALLVVAAAVAAFGMLAWEAWKGRVRLGVVLVAAGLVLVVSVAGPLLLSRDVYSYASYGRVAGIHDANPYLRPPSDFPTDTFTLVVSASWQDTVSVYGPAFTLASEAIARGWGHSASDSILAFKLLSGIGAAAAVWFAVATCRLLRPERAAFAATVVGLNPVLALHTVGGGHNDAVVAGGLAVAAWLAARWATRQGAARGPVSRGSVALGVTAILSLMAMVKIVALVPLILWMWTVARASGGGERIRALAGHAGVAAGVAALLLIPYAHGWETLRPVATLTSLEGWASGPRLVARIVRELAGSAPADGWTDRVVFAAFLGLFLVGLWAILRRARPESVGGRLGRGPAAPGPVRALPHPVVRRVVPPPGGPDR